MITRTGSGSWLSAFALMLLLLSGCAPEGDAPPLAQPTLEALLTPSDNFQELEIVQQLAQPDGQLVLFYYSGTNGGRWLAAAEIRQTAGGTSEVSRRYSSLQVSEACASPCTTFDVEQGSGRQRILLYGYLQDPDIPTVAIDLSDGRTLTRPVVSRAFIALWSAPGGGPGISGAVHEKIREIHE